MLDIQIPVDCPACGIGTRIIDIEEEPGYELEPRWVELFEDGPPVLMAEWVNRRFIAWILECGDRIPAESYWLRFEAPGIPPYFTEKE